MNLIKTSSHVLSKSSYFFFFFFFNANIKVSLLGFGQQIVLSLPFFFSVFALKRGGGGGGGGE